MKTQEVSQAQEILHAVEYNNFEEFYANFRGSQYILSCALIPFIHTMRENTFDIFEKSEKIPVSNLYKYLFFNSE